MLGVVLWSVCLYPSVRHAGLPDEASLHGCVAGLWASFSGIGRFSSRTVSGYLVDTIGFRNTSAIVVALHAFVVSGWQSRSDK